MYFYIIEIKDLINYFDFVKSHNANIELFKHTIFKSLSDYTEYNIISINDFIKSYDMSDFYELLNLMSYSMNISHITSEHILGTKDKVFITTRNGEEPTDNYVQIYVSEDDMNIYSNDKGFMSYASFLSTASGNYSHAEGSNTTASGDSSHAEGYNTTASGHSSHAEGDDTTASGSYSHAEGYNTTASGDNSHAEGYITEASGNFSHAEGGHTIASGNYSHASGSYTIANQLHQTVIGGYNNTDDTNANDSLFVVGNGISDSERSNAFIITNNGDIYVYGTIHCKNIIHDL